MTTNLDKPAIAVHGFTADASGALCGTYIKHDGLTAREHACIQLRVPKSGDAELDALIRESVRQELAGMAMQGFLASNLEAVDSFAAVAHADALLAALEASQ